MTNEAPSLIGALRAPTHSATQDSPAMTHKIDIIIPCHDHGRFLDECLERVTRQTRSDFAVLVMDDASVDDTAARVGEWMRRDARVRCRRNDGSIGLAENMRRGYELTAAEYVVILPADDLWEPEFLARTCAALDRHPQCAYAWSGWGSRRRPGEPPGRMAAVPHAQGGLVDDAPFLILQNYIPMPFGVFRRDACERAGGAFPADLPQAGERALWMRLAAEGPGYFVNEQLGRRRLHGDGKAARDSLPGGGGADEDIRFLDLVFAGERWPKAIRLLAKARQIQLLTGEKISATVRALGGDKTMPLMRDFVEADRHDLYLAAALVIRGYPEAAALNDTAGDADDLLAEVIDDAPEDSAYNLLGDQQGQATARRQLNKSYAAWLARRSFVAGDINIINEAVARWKTRPVFQILLRLPAAAQSKLADTLESLNHQFYGNWRVDIVTDAAAPTGIEAVANLGWHVVGEASQHKAAIDLLIAAERCDWIIELPPGAALDPLCLWRIADEADRFAEAGAFYVDDDVIGANGDRVAPRFKSELNIEWCRSTDLIGPLFVRRSALRAAGGVNASSDSPWYDLLWRLIESAGAGAIRAIPDVLVSYRDAFPSEPHACMNALAEHLTRQQEDCDVTPVAPGLWRVIHHPRRQPLVSVLIPGGNTLELVRPCIGAILQKTAYPRIEILIVADAGEADPETRRWLDELPKRSPRPVRVIQAAGSRPAALNLAARAAAGDYLLLLDEGARALQEGWLDELLAQGLRPGVGAVMPRLVKPQSGLIDNAGYVLGMNGLAGAPGRDKEKFSSDGYLGMLQVCREISAAPTACLLLAKEDHLAAGGLDENLHTGQLADIDFSLKLRGLGKRLIYTPFATLAHYSGMGDIRLTFDAVFAAEKLLAEAQEQETLRRRWGMQLVEDRLWNPNLGLALEPVDIDTRLLPAWRYLPGRVPRFLSRPTPNGSGLYRISQPLRAARQAGLAQECEALQNKERYHPAELARCGADVVLVNLFVHDSRLKELHALRRLLPKAFFVYACDDLITDMPPKSVFRKGIPADSRRRYQAALRDCDRLVVTTPYLAEASRGFIDDIRIVPNRLSRDPWLKLTPRKRAGQRPRIGWAGSHGHEGDLPLLKSIIEATRHEANWIFFGMCPREIRPLLAEYHEPVPFDAYPQKLAALDLDIAVAPLEDIPFNHAKSNLRLLDYGVLGLPVVCTDVPPYRDSPAKRVANTPKDWIAALRERIHDPDAAEREGAAMKDWVLRDYIVEDHLDEWLAAHLPD